MNGIDVDLEIMIAGLVMIHDQIYSKLNIFCFRCADPNQSNHGIYPVGHTARSW